MMTISANPDTPYAIYIIISLDEDILLGANGRNIVIIENMFSEHINHLF